MLSGFRAQHERTTKYDLQAAGSEKQSANYKLQATSYKLKAES
jgi:hypothetical protein